MPTDGKGRLEEAIILCGGLGTRLRDIAPDRPKALVTVRGRPFLEWLLLSLAQRQQIRRVILATGHMADMIEHHFGRGPWCGVRLTYSPEVTPLGTGGAVRLASSLSQSRDLLVLNGDTYCRFDSQRLIDVHVANDAAATMWLSRASDLTRFGSVAIDPMGRITGFREKSAFNGGHLANAGVYVLSGDLVARIQPDRSVSLESDVFPDLIGKGAIYGVEGWGPFVDIGTPESLAMSNEALEGELDDLNCQ